MRRYIQLLAFLLSLSLVLLLAGCGGSRQTIRYDLDGPVDSLDPQFTQEEDAWLILANTMEGLFRRGEEGELEPGLAESYTLSEDGLVYTFTLREGLTWSAYENEAGEEVTLPLTASDFVFAFRRMMDPSGGSAYGGDYRVIQGAAAIQAGSQPVETLGVEAVDDRTLVIRLEEPSEFFLDSLANPAAAPCNEQFFEETRGRYGMDRSTILSCGPMMVSSWDNTSRISLVPNPQYHSPQTVTMDLAALYIGRDRVQMMLDGATDCGPVTAENLQTMVDAGFLCQGYDDTVWGLVFNQQREELADQRIRSALQGAVDKSQLAGLPGVGFALTDGVVPLTALVGDQSYRDLAGAALQWVYNPTAARELLYQALADLGLEESPMLVLIVPQDSPAAEAAPYLQQMWQSALSLGVDVERLEAGEFAQRLQGGEYDIALTTLSTKSPTAEGTLEAYHSQSGRNVCGYQSGEYDRLLDQARSTAQVEEAASAYARAEDLLLSEVVVCPIYQQTSYFAVARSVEGLIVSPHYNQILFYRATREG